MPRLWQLPHCGRTPSQRFFRRLQLVHACPDASRRFLTLSQGTERADGKGGAGGAEEGGVQTIDLYIRPTLLLAGNG